MQPTLTSVEEIDRPPQSSDLNSIMNPQIEWNDDCALPPCCWCGWMGGNQCSLFSTSSVEHRIWLWQQINTYIFEMTSLSSSEITIQVDCASDLLQPVFTFLLLWWSLVVIYIITTAKEEVRPSSIESNNIHIEGIMSWFDGSIKQNFYPGDDSLCPKLFQQHFNVNVMYLT